MFTKPELVLVVLFGLLILLALFWLFRIEKRLKKFFLGKKARDLEEVIVLLEDRIEALEKAREEIEANLQQADRRLQTSMRGLNVVRFNPFPDQGSNQSFAIGILNEKEDGVVISSLYSRERMSVFAKPIKDGKSDYELTDEEKEALQGARLNS